MAGANMATNTDPLNDVLHSENHYKLTPEEIAKAVSRHKKNHSADKAANAAAKAQNAPAKAGKGPKS
jgi:hypothetical protein